MRNSAGIPLIVAVLGLVIVVVGYFLLGSHERSATSDDERVTRLEVEGFENIEIGGAPWFGCGEDDNILASYSFTAEKNGHTVDGVVCCGLLKSCTVRY